MFGEIVKILEQKGWVFADDEFRGDNLVISHRDKEQWSLFTEVAGVRVRLARPFTYLKGSLDLPVGESADAPVVATLIDLSIEEVETIGQRLRGGERAELQKAFPNLEWEPKENYWEGSDGSWRSGLGAKYLHDWELWYEDFYGTGDTLEEARECLRDSADSPKGAADRLLKLCEIVESDT